MILNGKKVKLPPNEDAVFQDGALIYITPRGVRHVDTGVYAPFIGGNGAMGCCPDEAKDNCEEIIREKQACPVTQTTVLPSLLESRTSDLDSGCNRNYMCVRLLRPPTGVGSVIDLMKHTTTLPIPLRFYNTAREKGSKIMFRKSEAQILDTLLVEKDQPFDTHLFASTHAGFYFGEVIKTKTRQAPPSRTNPLVVVRDVDGRVEEVFPSRAYLVDFEFDDDGSSSILIDGAYVRVGSRVFDKRTKKPLLVIGFNSSKKKSVTSLLVVSDLETQDVLSLSDVSVDGKVASLALTAGSTAFSHCPDDAKLAIAYYNNLSSDTLDAELLFHNAGVGDTWQNFMDVSPDKSVLNDKDYARRLSSKDMHSYLGIHSAMFDDDDSGAAELRKTANRALMSTNKFLHSLRWSEGDNRGFLQIKKRDGYAAPLEVNVSLAVDRFSLKSDCEQAIDSTLSLLDPQEYERLKERCKAFDTKPLHALGIASTSDLSARQILETCSDTANLNSANCVHAARRVGEAELEYVLGDAFLEYCRGAGRGVDERCVDGATVTTFFNNDVQDVMLMDAGSELLWPYLLVAIIALVFAVAGAIVMKNKSASLLSIGSILTLYLFARYLYPYKVEFAFKQLVGVFAGHG